EPALEGGADHDAEDPHVLHETVLPLEEEASRRDRAVHETRGRARRRLRARHEQEGTCGHEREAGGRGLEPGGHVARTRSGGEAWPGEGGLGDTISEIRGRLEDREGAQSVHDVAQSLEECFAIGALLEVRVDLGTDVGGENALVMVGKQLFDAAAVHAYPHVRKASASRLPSRRLARSGRARLMRLFTVPRGSWREVAISS